MREEIGCELLERATELLEKFTEDNLQQKDVVFEVDLEAAINSASNPRASDDELTRFCAIQDEGVHCALASNPSASRVILDYAGQRSPSSMLKNQVLEKWKREDPNWMYKLSPEWGHALMEELYSRDDYKTLSELFPRHYRMLCLSRYHSEDRLSLHLIGYRDPDEVIQNMHAVHVGYFCRKKAIRINSEVLRSWLQCASHHCFPTIASKWIGGDDFLLNVYDYTGRSMLPLILKRPDCPSELLDIAIQSGDDKLVLSAARNPNLNQIQQSSLARIESSDIWIALLAHCTERTCMELHQRYSYLPFLLVLGELEFDYFRKLCNNVTSFLDFLRKSFRDEFALFYDFHKQCGDHIFFGLGSIDYLLHSGVLEELWKFITVDDFGDQIIQFLMESPSESIRFGLVEYFVKSNPLNLSQRSIGFIRKLQGDHSDRVRLLSMSPNLVKYADLNNIRSDPSRHVRMAFVKELDYHSTQKQISKKIIDDFKNHGECVFFADDPDPAIRLKVLETLFNAYRSGFIGGVTKSGLIAEDLVESIIKATPNKFDLFYLIYAHVSPGFSEHNGLPLKAFDFLVYFSPERAIPKLLKNLKVTRQLIWSVGETRNSQQTLSKLALLSSPYAKAVAAANKMTPMSALSELSNDSHPLVKRALRQNLAAKKIT